jgi:hypothetical protein
LQIVAAERSAGPIVYAALFLTVGVSLIAFFIEFYQTIGTFIMGSFQIAYI